MKIVICEDDMRDAELIKELTESCFAGKKVDIKICSPEDVILQIEENLFDYDIAIMDIYFDGSQFTGIDVSAMINEVSLKCRVIYISNILEFAPQVYETKHVYFVLKKNMNVTLKRALNKAIESLNEDMSDNLIEIVSDNAKLQLRVSDIIYIEREQRLINYVTVRGSYQSYDSLGKAASKVTRLVRCHGSYKVNLDHIKVVAADSIIMDDGKTIPIGRTYSESFKKKYLEFFAEKI